MLVAVGRSRRLGSIPSRNIFLSPLSQYPDRRGHSNLLSELVYYPGSEDDHLLVSSAEDTRKRNFTATPGTRVHFK